MIGLLIFVAMASFAFRGNSRLALIRRARRKLVTAVDRGVMRMIMSKFEVLQADKIPYELNRLSERFDQMVIYEKKIVHGFVLASDIPRFIIDGMRVCFLVFIGTLVLK